MISAPNRPDEAASLAALHALEVLDSESEAAFNALVQAASAVCGTPISLISLVDAERQWFKANLGLPGVRETPRDLAFCAHAVLGDELFEVPDALQDERFFDNPLVTAAPNIRFYAGMPVRVRGGAPIGTLCVIDHQPRQLNEQQREVLRQLALAASQMLEGRLALRQTKAAHKDLAARLHHLRQLVDSVPSMLAYLNADLTYRFANRAYGEWFGVDADTLVGRHISHLLGPAVYGASQPRLEAALRGEPQVFERTGPGRGGRTRYSLVHYLPDVVDGVVVGLLIDVNDVTPLKLAESRASELQDELKRLAMVARLTSNAVLITDVQRRITWVNEGFERITGYSANEALGRTPRELVGFEGTDPSTVELLTQAQQNGTAITCEILNRSKTGRLYWTAKELQPLHDAAGQHTGFMSIESDITQRVQEQAARQAMGAEVRRSEALLRGAIDAIDEAFVLYDPEDRLVFCNDKYRAIYAASADLIVPGATFESIVREGARRGQYKDALGRVEEWVAERMTAHRSGNATLIQKIDDGRTLRIIERKMPDGHLVGFRIDITDLVRATEAAEEGSRAKSDFIATMSHELRTPLQSINGYAELGQHVAQREVHDRYALMFDKVLRGGQRMLSLVNDLLDLSAIDATALALTCRPEDLSALAHQVCEELESLAQARDLRFEWSPATPVLPVDGDAGRLQQVLRNVLANAIRFAPGGSAVVLAGVDLGNQGIELTVRDHGPGIPPDELEAIFDAFVQSSRTRDGSGGSGLGLAICRRIMSAHGGTITAENAPGAGALLRLRLPAVQHGFDRARPTAAHPATPVPHRAFSTDESTS